MPVRKITVERYFANFAKKEDKASCAIAMAMKMKGFTYPRVDENYIAGSLPETGERYWWSTPEDVALAIRRFDQTGEVQDVQFTLNTKKAEKVSGRYLNQPSAPKVKKMTGRFEENQRQTRKGRNYRASVPHHSQ